MFLVSGSGRAALSVVYGCSSLVGVEGLPCLCCAGTTLYVPLNKLETIKADDEPACEGKAENENEQGQISVRNILL